MSEEIQLGKAQVESDHPERWSKEVTKMNKSIPTVKELFENWRGQPYSSKFFEQEIQPLLDRLAEAEKPKTSLTKERFYELWAQEGAMGPLSAKRCWGEIESHAVIPEGYFQMGERALGRNLTGSIGWVEGVFCLDFGNGTRLMSGEVRKLPQKIPLTNSEKLAKLLPEVDAEKREAILKYITQEHLDTLCAEHGIALEEGVG